MNAKTIRRAAAALALVLLVIPACKRREDAGPTMMPGEDCVGCHMRESRAPKFSAAGTAYVDHPGSAPAVGATVTVTDSKGASVRMITNEVGNFYTTERLFPPLVARIEHKGVVREMKTRQPHGACNHCHRTPPRNDAPGRISATLPAAPPAQVAPQRSPQ